MSLSKTIPNKKFKVGVTNIRLFGFYCFSFYEGQLSYTFVSHMILR